MKLPFDIGRLHFHIRLPKTDKTAVTTVVLGLVVITAAFLTYFKGYSEHDFFIFDENTYVPSAHKYVEGIMFLQCHPPLGVMTAALGEALLKPNEDVDVSSFLPREKANTVPQGYSFAGVRFFPTLLAALSAGLFYLLMLQVFRSSAVAALFSSLYVFENGLIVHTSAAMLEGPQIFFILIALNWFVYLFLRQKPVRIREYAVLGLLVGLVVSVKVNGLILTLLFPMLYYMDAKYRHAKNRFRPAWDVMYKFPAAALLGGLVFLSVMYGHMSLMERAAGDNYYNVSEEYRNIVWRGSAGELRHFPIFLKEYVGFMSRYHQTAPRLNPYDATETGSFPIGWPFGKRSVTYRVEKQDGSVRALTLLGNPLVWYTGLIAVCLGLVLVLGRAVFGMPVRNRNLFNLITVFLFLYIAYMAAMMRIERVMFLYHYFVPLIFALITAGLVFKYIFEEQLKHNDKVLYVVLGLCCLLIIYTYAFFAPLTYYEPLSDLEFLRRSWFEFWRIDYAG